MDYKIVLPILLVTILGIFVYHEAFAAGALFDEIEYTIDQTVDVLVRDERRNLSPGVSDFFTVNVYSDSDPDGRQVIVRENGLDTGFYEGALHLTKHDDDPRRLHVQLGDKIYINYAGLEYFAKIIGIPIDCGPNLVTVDNQNCMTRKSIGLIPDTIVSITTLKDKVHRGDEISILGYAVANMTHTEDLTLKIINPELNTIVNEVIPIKSNNVFEFDFDTGNEIWDVLGDYTITASYAPDMFHPPHSSTDTFELRDFFIPIKGEKGKIVIMPNSNEPGCQKVNRCLLPTNLEIPVGGSATWINSDSNYEHVIVSGNEESGTDGLFNSGKLSFSDSFSYNFNETGIYHYHDSSFSWISGTIDVREKYLLSDSIPPLILLPENMFVNAENGKGAAVNFTSKAIDDISGILESECTHESGAIFQLGQTTVSCTAADQTGNVAVRNFTINVIAPDNIIPIWVKDVVSMWCVDKISDDTFIEAIQYLMDSGVIVAQPSKYSEEITKETPDWVRNNSCWWSEGKTTDEEFVNGLKFLISKGIIEVGRS